MQNKITKKAYSGKYINVNNETYFLAPERATCQCLGCDLLGSTSLCTKEVTQYCTQGFIFKKLKR